ncbi:MAG: tetratricopeptide repeat protein [Gammaproteobacteria bacterium]
MSFDPYSEEARLEALTTWLKANGAGIVAGVVLGLGIVFGWQFWTHYQQRQAEQASQLYEAFLKAVEEDNLAKARGESVKIIDGYPKSTYAVLTALMLAKLETQQNNNAEAAKQLEWVVAHGNQEAVVDIARLRLARVLLAVDKFSDAEAQLKQIKNSSFKADAKEIEGDILLARNQPDQARAAYEEARSALSTGGAGTLLQLKLDALLAPTKQPDAPAPASTAKPG